MLANTPSSIKPVVAKQVITSGQLDRTSSMQGLLKELKFLKELNKGVQSMKTYVYPSVLQMQALAPLKKAGGVKNVIIKYREMNGVKLTVMLPLLHNMIKFSIMEQAASKAINDEDDAEEKTSSDAPLVGSVILCHSQLRAAEMTDFTTELTQFCDEIVEVVNFDESIDDALAKLRIISAKTTSAEGTLAFRKSVALIGTPGNFVKLLDSAKLKMKFHSIVLDKVDLLTAMDFKEEIIDIGSQLVSTDENKEIHGKVIFTTNVREEKDMSVDE